ncbi:MAG: hypothetical protein LUE27_01580 [Clostridia bacterium]|nr:hypothetical protein [Clostridia bacterium]
MSSIKTNKLKFTADYDALDMKYDFFTVGRKDKKYIGWSAAALDASIEEKNISSILHAEYKDGNSRCIYVMMEKSVGSRKFSSEDNKKKLEDAVGKQEKAKDGSNLYDVDEIHFTENDTEEMKRNLAALLLYGVKNANSKDRYACNNLMGSMYCCTPDGRKGKKRVRTIHVYLDRKMRLSLGGAVFTNRNLSGLMNLGKHSLKDFPVFTVSQEGLPTITRYILKGDDDATSVYLQHQIIGRREKPIPFLDMSNLDAFDSSKMGCLCKILKLFKTKYGRTATLEFETIPDEDSNSRSIKRMSKPNRRKTRKDLVEANGGIINICNFALDDPRSESLLSLLAATLDMYQIPYQVSNEVSKEMMNILIIHDADFYDLPENAGIKDPHIESSEYIVQHVTVENFGSDDCIQDCLINKVIDEMVIKRDIKYKQLTIDNWEGRKYTTDWTFVVIEKVKLDDSTEKKEKDGQSSQDDSVSVRPIEKTYFYIMTIHPDGRFDIDRTEEEPECLKNFNDRFLISNPSDLICVIVRGDREDRKINYIVDTKLFTIPEIEKIRDQLKAGKKISRKKEDREELFGDILDIKYYRQGDSIFYYAGTIGTGMQMKVERSARIREVRAAHDNPLFFDEIVSLLDVNFIRDNQITVVPFPLKFIRAYKELLDGVRSTDEQ